MILLEQKYFHEHDSMKKIQVKTFLVRSFFPQTIYAFISEILIFFDAIKYQMEGKYLTFLQDIYEIPQVIGE